MSDVAAQDPAPITDDRSVGTSENLLDMDSAIAELVQEDQTEEKPAEGEQPEVSEVDEDDIILGAEGEESEPESEDSEADLVEIVVDGEALQVSHDELKQGYSRQQDYTRKTQALAAERTALEAQQAQFNQEAEAQRQTLQTQLQIIQQLGPMPKAPDLSMLDPNSDAHDAEGYITQKALYDAAVDDYKSKVGQLEATQQEANAKREQEILAWRTEQDKILLAAVPELADSAKVPIFENRRTNFLRERGFTVEEMNMIQDGRMNAIVFDALRWEIHKGKAASKADVAAKKVKGVPKVAKPGVKRAEGQDVEDARNAILEKADKRGGMTIDDAVKFLVPQ